MSTPSAGRGIEASAGKSIFDSKILIVDDEPLACRLLAGILRRRQFTNIRFAAGGRSALELVNTFEPDLVLLDMQMPDLGGMEVCRLVRADPAHVDLPILVQTATVDRKEMGLLFEAGASDFLSKPINPSELVSRVTVHLERRNLLGELRAYRKRTSLELDAARRMQFDLLPAPPIQEELAAAAGMRVGSFARSSSEIGGDLWGMVPINAASFGIFLADFAGHGVTAALNTFRLHALIHEHAALHGDPARLLAMLNERLVAVLPPGQFATFVYIVLDSAADRISFASAGAPPPIVMAGLDGPAVLAEVSGLPLGVVRGAEYRSHDRPFGPDSMLLLFSDGLSEFPDDRGRRIGDEGLRSVVGACHPGLTPHQVIDRLCEAAGVGEDNALPDDTTVICVDRRTGSASRSCRECMVRQNSMPEVRRPCSEV
jgi:sigma-B regulation protein RsbU (phosphoserine phosphatase)